MVSACGSQLESLERLEERHNELLVREEEEGDAALDLLIEQMADQEPPEREPEAAEPGKANSSARVAI